MNDHNEYNNRLHLSMKQEISAMREILANMHQEEVCLRKKDDELFERVLADRTSLIAHLNDLRSERFALIIELGKHLNIGSSNPSLEEVVSEEDENCELLMLQGQIHALSERMQTQLEENQQLFEMLSLPNIQQPPYKQYEKQLGTKTISPGEEEAS